MVCRAACPLRVTETMRAPVSSSRPFLGSIASPATTARPPPDQQGPDRRRHRLGQVWAIPWRRDRRPHTAARTHERRLRPCTAGVWSRSHDDVAEPAGHFGARQPLRARPGADRVLLALALAVRRLPVRAATLRWRVPLELRPRWRLAGQPRRPAPRLRLGAPNYGDVSPQSAVATIDAGDVGCHAPSP